jgi:hypothetical protein
MILRLPLEIASMLNELPINFINILRDLNLLHLGRSVFLCNSFVTVLLVMSIETRGAILVIRSTIYKNEQYNKVTNPYKTNKKLE